LYCCRYILSAFIFILYFINAINGLNIDYKEVSKMVDILLKNGEFMYYMSYNFNIDIDLWDNIDNNLEDSKNLIPNKIFAVENNNNGNCNNNGNHANETERSPSPIIIDNLPRHISPVLSSGDSSSDDGFYVDSSDEGEKEPSAENNYNPEYSARAAKIEELKLKRVGLKMDIHDLMVKRNNDVRSLYSGLRKAQIIEETQTISPENKAKATLKRS